MWFFKKQEIVDFHMWLNYLETLILSLNVYKNNI